MLDPNCRPLAIADRSAYVERIEAVLGRVDVVKASVDDLVYLRPGIAANEAARGLLERAPTLVLLTDGGRPVRVLAPEATFEVAVPPVEVVDTVGAGDAFGGAFLAHWVERGWGRGDLIDTDRLREAVTFATEIAAATCGRAGADPPGPMSAKEPPR